MVKGWVKIHRSILDWRWWSDDHMMRLWLYLIITAGIEDRKWRDITVRRGQVITTLPELSEKTGISIQTLRTCLSRLEESGEINSQSTNKYRVITICKFNTYQIKESPTNRQSNRQLTDNQQTTNRQTESSPHTPLKDIQEYKNRRISLSARARGAAHPFGSDKEREKFLSERFFIAGLADPKGQVRECLGYNLPKHKDWRDWGREEWSAISDAWIQKRDRKKGYDPKAGEILSRLSDLLRPGSPDFLETLSGCRKYPLEITDGGALLTGTPRTREIVRSRIGDVKALFGEFGITNLKIFTP